MIGFRSSDPSPDQSFDWSSDQSSRCLYSRCQSSRCQSSRWSPLPAALLFCAILITAGFSPAILSGCSAIDDYLPQSFRQGPVAHNTSQGASRESSEEAGKRTVENDQTPGQQRERAPITNNIGINNQSSPYGLSPGVEGLDIRNLKRSSGHKAAIIGLFVSASGDDIVSGDEAGAVLLWKAGIEPYQVVTFPNKLQAASFSKSSGTVAALSTDNVLYVVPEARVERLKTRGDLEMRIASIDLSPDGRSILLGSADSRVYRWRFLDEETANGQRERERTFERYVAHASVVSAVSFHPLGRIFFSGDWMGRVNVSLLFDADRFKGEYDKNIFEGRAFSERQVVRKGGPRASRAGISVLRVSDGGKFLVVGDETGEIGLWQVRGFRQVASVQAHKGSVLDADIRSDLSRIVSLGRDGHLRGWTVGKDDRGNFSLTPLFDSELFEARAIASFGTGNIGVGFADGTLRVINPAELPAPTPTATAGASMSAAGAERATPPDFSLND